MRLERGTLGFVALAVVLAAVFVRLGFWQLDRMRERAERNALRSARLALPAIPFPSSQAAAWPESLFWRRVRVTGTYDAGREVVVRGRSHEGRPAVEVLTPLRPEAGAAVLVLRGWLPSADALHAPLDSARPSGDLVTVEGIAVPGAEAPRGGPVTVESEGRERIAVTRAHLPSLGERLPYPLAGAYLHATDPGPAGPALRRLPEPELGAGPHLGYAIQWFSFAAVALIGAAAYAWKGSPRARQESTKVSTSSG